MARDEAAIRSAIKKNNDRIGELNNANLVLDEQIDRLKNARDRVKACKNEYRDRQSRTSRITDASYKWKGQRYKATRRTFDTLEDADKKAVKDIDAVLDAIERDIGRYQNKKMENLGLIGKLGQAVNSLWHELKTLAN